MKKRNSPLPLPGAVESAARRENEKRRLSATAAWLSLAGGTAGTNGQKAAETDGRGEIDGKRER